MLSPLRFSDRKTEHFKALTKQEYTSAIADHIKATGHKTEKGVILKSSRPEKLITTAR